MRIRTLVVGLMVSGLALTACGKEGTPADSGNGEQSAGPQPPTYEVAQNVDLAGSPTFEKMKQAGKATVGVKEDQPELGYKDPTTGEYSGFDIEIARLVSAGLGFEPSSMEYKPVPSAGREQAIVNGDVDYYVGTYTINDKRKQQISFAGPYFRAGQSLLVAKDNTDITGKDALKGKKVCSVSGSTPIQNVRDEGLTEPGNIVELQNYSQCVNQLASGQVDAVTTDDAILKGYAAQEPDSFKVVGEPFSDEPYGIGLPKDDKVLRDKVNDILQAAIDDGTWQQIYDATLGKSGSESQPPALERY
ncbi:ABC transporter substrate-binding protein [Prauserella marina]|uniref:Glutamate transport system substrate-binding protein n=1 Tax=Prauserella marina TaxID=530584 RepID=A0A222VU83_9PSEU|nr:glutamate ABC transporter substrate-binding protein [Prauserella marina]ASR37506.1 ABC transporter substrate-binding protein [Prauserella marina]PWV75394.1 amino acid ABC transporter substrate-binding protein (PAAT family) [Prauserella marina]SDD35589.1 glutamate transport system substrate-binding protein [Prauserella marina]